jgi:hypothetical protein
MVPDRLQLQRLELKYIIREELALQVRDFVSSYLVIDEYGATMENLSYPVHSLYLDSNDLCIYWGTINGNKNRYKLRLRFYADKPEAPVFFEIKRRMNEAILKQRGAVKRASVSEILAGHFPSSNMLIQPDNGKHLVAVQRFCELMLQNHASPKAHVAYSREAWVSQENNAIRVTLDRDVRCCPEPTARLASDMENPAKPFGSNVVLELKFTGRFPAWFRDLAHVFGLVQCSAAKYVDGVAMAGEDLFSPFGYNQPDRPRALEQSAERKMFLEKLQLGEYIKKN